MKPGTPLYTVSGRTLIPAPQRSATYMLIAAVVLSVVLSLAPAGGALAAAPDATFVVTNANNSGSGSLRDAINKSNAAATGPRIISFDIPGSGAHTINLTSALPAIIRPVTLDGLTQPGAGCNDSWPHTLLIVLDGTGAGAAANGILVIGGSSIIRGLAIQHFSGDGVHIQSAGNVSVECNYIGTNAAGSAVAGNSGNGVTIDNTPDNLVGHNLISGNTVGVSISGPAAKFNHVVGNRIGTNAAGNAAIPNAQAGVFFQSIPANYIGGNTAGLRNIISGNSGPGIELEQTDLVDIQGNYIGTDANGTGALANHGVGISLFYATNTVIGGSQPVQANVISGNLGHGIHVYQMSTNVRIVGNRIGVNAAATAKLTNGGVGVFVNNVANTVVGAPGAGNVIGGNGQQGVLIYGPGAHNNSVRGNFIGLAPGGQVLGNSSHGVEISDASTNSVGGPGNGDGNWIAFNGGAGVYVVATDRPIPTANVSGLPVDLPGDVPSDAVQVPDVTGQAINDAILANAIFANGGLGIDLDKLGVAPNDGNDSDDGPNHLQNYPELGSATAHGSTTTVVGALTSTPNTTYHLEFFANDTCDPSHYGEGQRLLGSYQVTSNGAGVAGFSVDFAAALPAGTAVTVTATDPAGNTSEFSHCYAVTNPSHGWVNYLPYIVVR